jgi:hypothetical protein
MAKTLEADAPDGSTLEIDIPDGTDPSLYPHMVDDAMAHYTSQHPGNLESFGRGAANNFPLANQAIAALSPGDYSGNIKGLADEAALAKENNPVPYYGGAVVGGVAPMAIPGVGTIAGGAALGAADAVGNTDVLKHPGEALRQGAVGGVLGGAITGGLNKLAPGALSAESLTTRAEKNAVQSAGLNPKAMEDTGKFQKMGSFINDRRNLIDGSLESRHAAAEAAEKSIGEQVGALKDRAASYTNPADVQSFTDPLMEKASHFADYMDPYFKAEGNVYQHGAQDIQRKGMTMEGLQELKTAYGNRAFNNKTGEVKSDAAKDVWVQVTKAMDNLMGKSAPEYQAAKTQYEQIRQVNDGIAKQLGLVRTENGSSGVGGHGIHSFIKQIPGIESPSVALPTAGLLAAGGHEVLAAVVGAHALTSNPGVRNRASNFAAKNVGAIGNAVKAGSIDSIISALTTNPQSLGKFRGPLQQAAQGGRESINATNYILETGPNGEEYKRMKAGGEDETK